MGVCGVVTLRTLMFLTNKISDFKEKFNSEDSP